MSQPITRSSALAKRKANEDSTPTSKKKTNLRYDINDKDIPIPSTTTLWIPPNLQRDKSFSINLDDSDDSLGDSDHNPSDKKNNLVAPALSTFIAEISQVEMVRDASSLSDLTPLQDPRQDIGLSTLSTPQKQDQVISLSKLHSPQHQDQGLDPLTPSPHTPSSQQQNPGLLTLDHPQHQDQDNSLTLNPLQVQDQATGLLTPSLQDQDTAPFTLSIPQDQDRDQGTNAPEFAGFLSQDKLDIFWKGLLAESLGVVKPRPNAK